MKKHNNSKMREGKNSRKNEKARKNSRKRGDDMIKNSVSKRKQVIKKISVGILSTALVSSNALGTLSLANVSELVATDEKVIDLAQKNALAQKEALTEKVLLAQKNTLGNSLDNGLNFQKDIRWVKGITPPTVDDFKAIPDGNFTFYTVADKVGSGWFDVNKKRGQQDDAILCSAAVSANMLHWWLEQNSENVSRFLSIEGNDEKRELGGVEIKPLTEFINSYKYQDDSRIFEIFTDYFGIKEGQPSRTVWADTVTDMFINGYYPNLNGNTNDESKYKESTLDKRGGYFKDVFGKTILTSRIQADKKEKFNETLKAYLNDGKAIGLSYHNGGRMGHIINVWGAEFDEKGDAVAVYVTDSDDQSSTYTQLSNKKRGLFRYHVVYGDDGETKISALTTPEAKYGGKVLSLYGLSLGTEQWEKYYEKIEREKAEKNKLKEKKKSDENSESLKVDQNLPIGRANKKDPLAGDKDEAKAELRVNYDRIIMALNNGSDYADLVDKTEIVKKLGEIIRNSNDSIEKAPTKDELDKQKQNGLVNLQKELAKADFLSCQDICYTYHKKIQFF